MNTSTQEPNPDPNTPPPENYDRHEPRRAERWARRETRWQRHAGRPYGWFGGLMLTLIGAAILMENLGLPFLTNWWALFILIPAFGAFFAAWEIYQDHGRLIAGAAGSLSVGILLTVLALVFLLGLDIGLFWPVLLMAGGLVLVATAFFPGSREERQ
jgi:hypothetical protein